MSYQPHLIAQYEEGSGLNTYFEPFIIPEKAFPVIEDAVCWRGRVRKRRAYQLLNRLRRRVTTTTGVAAPVVLSVQAPFKSISYTCVDVLADANIDVRTTQPNGEIQPRTVHITVGAVTFDDLSGDGNLYSAALPSPITGTINYITGEINLTFPMLLVDTDVTVDFYYYPALPVMGLRTRETTNVNDETVIAFDTIYSYQLAGTQFSELPSTFVARWHGSNSDFFWSTNYLNGSDIYFFATNSNGNGAIKDPLRLYSGSPGIWSDYTPAVVGGGTVLFTCLCIVPYKDRLLAFNTWEGTGPTYTNFSNRLRYSQNGTVNIAVEADAWRSDIVGKGGYINIPTSEDIVSVEFIKDILIVKCERSSWKCIYTGNEVLPFVFQKINTELGAESTFSLVPFDDGVLSVGNVSITNDDGVNVIRIDQQIPQYAFFFNNDFNGVKRIHGIRDYYNELVYWNYPDQETNVEYPNKTLVYNYVNRSFSVFNESFTCFGYFQRTGDETWADLNYLSWAEWTSAWNSGVMQSLFPNVIAGNQQGYVEIINQDQLGGNNGQSLSIVSINPVPVPAEITVPNHNLRNGDIIKIDSVIGLYSTALNDLYFRVYIPNPSLFPNNISLEIFDPATQKFSDLSLTPQTYIGGGRISYVNGINIQTKIFAPFYDAASQCRLGYTDFLLDKTSDGEVTVNIYVDESQNISINNPASTSGNVGLVGSNRLLTRPENPVLIPYQAIVKKIWHRIFTQCIAQNFQIQIAMTDEQKATPAISKSDFVLHATAFYLSKNARLTQ